ncbi:hypothetical protein Rsub_12261 [Raphidocelis subcapitata]|uniref:AP2/ERF domain-containing protein n=1 Tax=Raphidocelis subcapitata TaxID=307507 RepID=A0A2V0PIN6_9CHLO|nr:hypothetical protein Rsub_12261 [Raphidocelis subcapitata]|eukprot:GBF99429.1 hypothetical protein Rsub_12261 [Raphidocelis subcapitata]
MLENPSDKNLAGGGEPYGNGGLYKGVYADKFTWRVRVYFKGRQLHVGSFDSPQVAAQAYDCAALVLIGPKAVANFGERSARSHLAAFKFEAVWAAVRAGLAHGCPSAIAAALGEEGAAAAAAAAAAVAVAAAVAAAGGPAAPAPASPCAPAPAQAVPRARRAQSSGLSSGSDGAPWSGSDGSSGSQPAAWGSASASASASPSPPPGPLAGAWGAAAADSMPWAAPSFHAGAWPSAGAWDPDDDSFLFDPILNSRLDTILSHAGLAPLPPPRRHAAPAAPPASG